MMAQNALMSDRLPEKGTSFVVGACSPDYIRQKDIE
jgi:hypothetical protein